MSEAHGICQVSDDVMLALVAGGDCSRLTNAQKMAYYRARCEAAGLDPRTQPFGYIRTINRKTGESREVLYALKAATDQLSAIHGIVCEIVSQVTEAGIRTVTVRARAKDGRQTDDIGAVPIQGLSGDDLCNALMRAVTKAKRRAILSLCGLGMLDESELDTMDNKDTGVVPVPPPAKITTTFSSSNQGALPGPVAPPAPVAPEPKPQPPPAETKTESTPPPASEKNGEKPEGQKRNTESLLVLVEAVTRGSRRSSNNQEYWGVKLGTIGSSDPSMWYSTYHKSIWEKCKEVQKSLKKFLADVTWSQTDDGRRFGWVDNLTEVTNG